MALCLRLPLQLPPISKNQYFQCCRYLMWSSLRSTKKSNGKKYLSSQGPSVEKRNNTRRAPNVSNRKLEEMFESSARSVCEPYLALLTTLTNDIPTPPPIWQFKSGWTCYLASGPAAVEFPAEDALVFDVEVCVREGFYPTLAAAVSPNAWYLWVSPRLIKAARGLNQPAYMLDDLIPLGKSPSPRVVVGHFVSYDRARIREEYNILQETGMRFFDTLSAHVCVSGVTSAQRNLMFSSLSQNEKWRKLTSPNSLAQLSEFYCGLPLNKTKRDVFVKGSLQDIAKDFQLLSSYCVEDVIATHKVFCKLFPLFLERHPHPVSMAGMLELSTPLFPVTKTWDASLRSAEESAKVLRRRQFDLMTKCADEYLDLATDELYKYDPWMWDQSWKLERMDSEKIPSWYKMFLQGCANSLRKSDATSVVYPGLTIPKILRLRCGPFPLHYIPRLGWGVIVPEQLFVGQVTSYLEDDLPLVPVKQIGELCSEPVEDACLIRLPSLPSLLEALEGDLYWRESSFTTSVSEEVGVSKTEAAASVHELLISHRTVFRKIFNVGGPRAVRNPLGLTMAKSLTCLNSPEPAGKEFLEIRDRLLPWLTHWSRWTEQNVVWLEDPAIGVILPQMDVCADYLRFPRDRSWTPLMALQPKQVGADLLKHVEAPGGHLLVSICFNNLDLWFASLFGDTLKGIRGSTKFSSYFLSGVLFEEMALDLDISKDEAKCFCHAVVAGADTYMLSKLVCQVRVNTSREEAYQQACRVMDLLVDYGLLSASPAAVWPHIDADELRSPLLGSRLSRPLEFEKNRVRLRAQWMVHSSKTDFLHLFITHQRSLTPNNRLCFVYGDIRCLYLVPDQYPVEESFNLTHQAVQSFCLSRFGLPPHRNDPSSLLVFGISRNLSNLHRKIEAILSKINK